MQAHSAELGLEKSSTVGVGGIKSSNRATESGDGDGAGEGEGEGEGSGESGDGKGNTDKGSHNDKDEDEGNRVDEAPSPRPMFSSGGVDSKSKGSSRGTGLALGLVGLLAGAMLSRGRMPE